VRSWGTPCNIGTGPLRAFRTHAQKSLFSFRSFLNQITRKQNFAGLRNARVIISRHVAGSRKTGAAFCVGNHKYFVPGTKGVWLLTYCVK